MIADVRAENNVNICSLVRALALEQDEQKHQNKTSPPYVINKYLKTINYSLFLIIVFELQDDLGVRFRSVVIQILRDYVGKRTNAIFVIMSTSSSFGTVFIFYFYLKLCRNRTSPGAWSDGATTSSLW